MGNLNRDLDVAVQIATELQELMDGNVRCAPVDWADGGRAFKKGYAVIVGGEGSARLDIKTKRPVYDSEKPYRGKVLAVCSGRDVISYQNSAISGVCEDVAKRNRRSAWRMGEDTLISLSKRVK